MSEIIFKDLSIEHICKPKLKHSYISVNHDLKVILKTPKVSKFFIESLLLDKEQWIRKQLLKLSLSPQQRVNLEDEILLFGEIFSIDIEDAKYLRAKLNRLRKYSRVNILKCYDDFYKQFSLEYLIPRVEYFANKMDLKFSAIKFRKMKSRWGSCSNKRVITFNSELVKVKKELIDYVIVHELAHLIHMNHSKNFHSVVENYLPSSRILRKELKDISLPSL